MYLDRLLISYSTNQHRLKVDCKYVDEKLIATYQSFTCKILCACGAVQKRDGEKGKGHPEFVVFWAEHNSRIPGTFISISEILHKLKKMLYFKLF